LNNKSLENTGEFILQNQYQVGIETNNITPWLLPGARGISKFSDEFGVMYATNEFYNSYGSGDKRAQEQQYYFSRYPSIKDPNTIVDFGGYYIYKYFDQETAINTAQSDLNWTLLRYAEVLLVLLRRAMKLPGLSNLPMML
jgi:hypothetical protein